MEIPQGEKAAGRVWYAAVEKPQGEWWCGHMRREDLCLKAVPVCDNSNYEAAWEAGEWEPHRGSAAPHGFLGALDEGAIGSCKKSSCRHDPLGSACGRVNNLVRHTHLNLCSKITAPS